MASATACRLELDLEDKPFLIFMCEVMMVLFPTALLGKKAILPMCRLNVGKISFLLSEVVKQESL